MTARTHAPRNAAASTTPKPNRFGGKCRKPGCGQWVEAGAGALVGSKATGWGTEHHAGACPAPKPAATTTVIPDLGYYVRTDGAAIKVVESKRLDDHGNPRRYGVVFTPHPPKRPSWDYVRGAGISVADLRPLTAADAAALGLSAGHCIFCCTPLGGKTLSAAVSALIGYGETCAKNNALPYPKGVVAQRAFIAENGR
jgi:hypothetical protein